VIYVTADSATPMEATAFTELWRTNQCELAEVECSDVMNETGKPKSKHAPRSSNRTRCSPLSTTHRLVASQHQIGWPEMLAQVQALTGFQQPTPCCTGPLGQW